MQPSTAYGSVVNTTMEACALAEFLLSLRQRRATLTIGVEFSRSKRSIVDLLASMRTLNSSFGIAWITMPYFGLRTERPSNEVSQLICRSSLGCSSVLHRIRTLSALVLLLLIPNTVGLSS